MSKVDLDFGSESCEDVLLYLRDTYGSEKVASIGKFGCSCTKGMIRDLAKVFGIELAQADLIAKAFGEYEIDEIHTLIDCGEKIPNEAQQAVKYIEEYPELFEYVDKLTGVPDVEEHLHGLPKSFGLHSCGKIIATQDLDYYLPSCYDKNGIRFLQGDMHDVEDVGLVKIDLLGLRTVDQEYETLGMSGEVEEFVSPKQDFTDEKTLNIFKKGDTYGIFQFSSNGMKQVLKKMNPSNIDDLSVANALFRPGSLAYIDNYCRRKNGEETFEYLHPDLEPILKNTYGIMVFQEQLIEIGRMAGLRNPDLLRKATAKKKKALLDKIKPELEEKLKARGWTDEQFGKLWDDMLEFGKYSFNKCVTGDTEIWIVERGKEEKLTVKEVCENFKIAKDAKQPGFFLTQLTKSLSMDSDKSIVQNRIVDANEAGIQNVYLVATECGKYIKCTSNHKFPTPNGDKPLSALNVGDKVYVTFDGVNITLDEIETIHSAGREMTYDISMMAPNHNFIANNGIVTSNSHSSAYAIIAYLTAKQKAYYPVEFYAGFCNSYIGKSEFVKEEAEDTFSDMSRHNITIAPFSFRNDHRKCSVRDGKIIYAIPLLRDLNVSVGEILYRNSGYDGKYFWRLINNLLIDGIGEANLTVLIKLGFFNELCSIREATRIFEFYKLFKFGKTITMKKASVPEDIYKMVEENSVGVNAKGEPLQSFKEINIDTIMCQIEDKIKEIATDEISIKVRIENQKKYIGAAPVPTGNDTDRKLLYIKNVYPVCRKSDGKQFAYSVVTKSVGSGVSSRMTVMLGKYKNEPINEGDLIYCDGWDRNGQYFTLTAYHHIYA